MPFRDVIWHIEYQDRVGLGMEIFRCFADHGAYVDSLDANVKNGMILRFNIDETDCNQLYESILQIEAITQVTPTEFIPVELQESEINVLLNLTEKAGVLIVDQCGKIVHINNSAAQSLQVSKRSVLGQPIENLVNQDFPIVHALHTGSSLYRKEIWAKVRDRNLHCIFSAQPIFNEDNTIIGAVAAFLPVKKSSQGMTVIQPSPTVDITFSDIIHVSQNMKYVVDAAKAAAQTDTSILLQGETGTGKEMFAKAIHASSHRRNGPFISVNCGAFPENLLESELFGYVEGTFTGAIRGGKPGLFEQAKGGTLFLDEVGECSPNTQVHLLRVLQEHAIRRIGASEEIPLDIRIISATNKNLESMIRSDKFREDLYYRLNVIPLHIPPLRERKQDIYPLIQHLMKKLTHKLHRDVVTIEPTAMEILVNQEWPGNVRQLENCIERLLVLVPGKEITHHDLSRWLDSDSFSSLSGLLDASKAIRITLQFSEWPSLREMEKESERQLLMKVLERFPTSRKAANILGVSNTTVLNKIKQLNIAYIPYTRCTDTE